MKRRYRIRDLQRLSFDDVHLFAVDESDAIAVASLRLFGIAARHGKSHQAFVPAIGAVATVVELDGGMGPNRSFSVELVDEDCVVRR